MGYGPSIDFAIQKKFSSALVDMWEIICEIPLSLAEHMQGMDVRLAYTVPEFA